MMTFLELLPLQRLGDLGIAAHGVGADAFLVFLQADEEVFHVFVELGGAGIGPQGGPGLGRPR